MLPYETNTSGTFSLAPSTTTVKLSIVGKLQEKVSLVAAMSQMPDMAGQKMAVGTRHRFTPLKRAFYYRKDASKR